MKKFWWLVVAGFVFGGFIWVSYFYWAEWAGLYTPKGSAYENWKTLWDWLDLLIIPLVLVIGGFFLNRAQRQTELAIAGEERKTERQIAKDREEERALQNYLEAMTKLLLEEGLRTSKADSEVRCIARSRTLTILNGLDNGRRKGNILRFLYEAKLIEKWESSVKPEKTVVLLEKANLDKTDLKEVCLEEINLGKANLQGADLRGVDLSRSYLEEINLQGADLRRVDLSGADLWHANLREADLGEARLWEAHLARVDLKNANLDGAKLYKAYLGEVDLRNANLQNTDLRKADLSQADLEGAILSKADVSGANLGGTNLNRVNLEKTKYNLDTIWPKYFDPEEVGGVLVDE